jgi:hypothetical protein
MALAACLLALGCLGQNYQFNGTISREVLDNYLERSITMQGQSDIEGASLLSETERLRNITMLQDIGAKFVGRIAGWWENGWGQTNHDNFFAKCATNVANLKANDPQVICQAAVFEYVSGTVGTFSVPAYVFQAFGLPVQSRTFNHSAMQYPAPASQYTIYGRQMTEGERAWIPDVTQQETQLWLYYMATRYISVGCEAIHFGQPEIMNRRDVGNQQWWALLQKVRAYGATRNRGVVVCDAHTANGGLYYEPGLGLSQSQWQSYVPTHKPNGQLLYDFHSVWVNFQESSPCSSTYQPAIFGLDPNKGLHGRSLGGINPQGWKCTRNPYLVEFDNGGVSSAVGCFYNTAEDWYLWGWDEISWLALQPEQKRNQILQYAFYKIKCIDKNGHLEMPGMRGVTPGNGNSPWTYRANTGNQNQQATIKNLWANANAGSSNWVHQNFTKDAVLNQPNPPHVASSLVLYGTDRMYYIATDGYVHGYIRDAGLNTWQTVSPSYSAQIYGGINVASQVKAKSDLVVSPDGTTLLYIGTDGYIHGFNMVNVWNYTYFDFVKSPMVSQSLKAHSHLLFASNTRAYYIAKESNGAGNARVHGFIKYNGNWVTVSPTYGSQVPATSMTQAAGGLTYNASDNRLYYVGTDGFLYYYTINNDWAYTYYSVPQTQFINQTLRIMPNKLAINGKKVFYVGKELGNGNALRIHALTDNNGTWSTVSPSWSAHTYNGQPIGTQVQASSATEIAVSPDQQLVAYLGSDGQVYYYKDINGGWNFSYNKTWGAGGVAASNSLFYTDNSTLYYNSAQMSGDYRVHYVKWQESYCQNPAITVIEPGYTYSRQAAPALLPDGPIVKGGIATQDNSGTIAVAAKYQKGAGQISVYPNPASTELHITLPPQLVQRASYRISNANGQVLQLGMLNNLTTRLSLQKLTAGTYLFVIYNGQQAVIHQKLIVAK